jgi:WD40 repeat protein
MSPDGHTRCLGDEFKLDNTNLFIDEYEPTVFATHLQKYHYNKGNAYFPTMHNKEGIDYIDNEVYSDTKFLRCNSGYVPKPKGIPDVTGSSNITADVLSYYSGTCSGYTCQRCPVNFIEQNQRCVQCPPGMIAGWEYNRLQMNNERAENSCFRVSVPKGHFMDVQNPAGVELAVVGTPSFTRREVNPFDGVDVGYHSKPAFVDVDNDGDMDLVIGRYEGHLNFYYENTGSVSNPSYTRREGALSPFDGIDVGSYSAPAFVDVDNDGDMDLVIGRHAGDLIYYENTGSTSNPSYTRREGALNPFDVVDVGDDSVPAFVDTDNDGDMDLVIGRFDGDLIYYENTGSASNPLYTRREGALNPFDAVDGVWRGAPAFVDIDDDGDMDLVIGRNAGNLYYCENTGSPTHANYTRREGALNPFDAVDVGSFSVPAFVDLDNDGDMDIVIGRDEGDLNYFYEIKVSYPYTTHCDHWLYHPAGDMGAYQDEENQYKCKIARPGKKAVIDLDTRVVTTWNNPGQKVSNDRTRAINCAEYEVCDGEQIIGCEPGHIWYRQTNDREDEECVKCNEDDSIYVLHGEKDDYEYCDGTYKFQCDLGTHTYGDILDGDYAKRYVGIRDTWRGSNLVHYVSQTNKSLDGSKQYIYRPDWDIDKARIQADLPWVMNVAHAGEVSALANRGDMVVSGGRSYDGGETLKLWNKTTGTSIPLNGQSGSIKSVDIASDGKIVSASYDGSVALWTDKGTLIWTTTHHEENMFGNGEVTSVAFSPDGTNIVSGGSDGSVIVQDIAGDLNQTLTGHSEVYTVAWGDFIVSGGKDNVRKWENGESTVLIDVPYVESVAIYGSTVIAAARETIYINDISTSISASSDVYELAFSPDGQYFVSVGDDIQVWSIYGTPKRQMPPSRLRTNVEAYGHVRAYNSYNPSVILNDQSIKSVTWGDEIITGGKDKTIRIWKDWDQNNHTHVRLSMVEWHEQSKCLPVPDEYFALDGEWKIHNCGYAKEHCIHRTFHRIYPFIYPTIMAPKYMFTQAVRETSYDEIFRFTDRQCLDGYLKDGCLKEYCSREGQTNCWCGEEEDFCTMACADGMCVPACSEQVCDPDYEICLGVGDSGRCARACAGTSDNYCVINEGGVKVCRHYNEDWNSTRLQSLDPQPDSPCFSYMPNIPETQCKDVFDNECFCNREYIDDENYCCLDKIIEPRCSEPQDDGTCTYLPQENLDKRDCVCGDKRTKDDNDNILTCYSNAEGYCGKNATLLQDCIDLHEDLINTRTQSLNNTQCRPTGEGNVINSAQCRLATDITKSFGSWDNFIESLTCTGTDSFEPGCLDPHADNYNQYAVIPKKCEY